MKKVAIVSAYRSAIGSFMGSLAESKPADLGAYLTRFALEEKGIAPTLVDEVILGNVLGSGFGQNIARQIAIKAGLPLETSAFVVNKVCGSGLKAILLGAQSIQLGENEIVVAGGIEMMSQAPYLAKNMRQGNKLGHSQLEDSILVDGLTDAFSGMHMGMTAEYIAERYHISRQEQDRFALSSQTKALAAIANGRFSDEIVPIPIKKGQKESLFRKDEYPRETTLEKLAQLRPAFKENGSVTAGNASGINDGCALVVLMSEEKAQELNLKPLAYIESYATSGLDPDFMGMGPVLASKKALLKAGLSVEDIDLYEMNEAFAAQAIAVQRELELDAKKVNVNGGAIALGHPIGASGARILVSLVHELLKEKKTLGLCSLCIGGGQGISLLISNANKG